MLLPLGYNHITLPKYHTHIIFAVPKYSKPTCDLFSIDSVSRESRFRDLKISKNTKVINPFQPIVAFHKETSHLICSANQMTGFYMECNTGLKWVNPFHTNGLFYNP